jgi:hypothetical protein
VIQISDPSLAVVGQVRAALSFRVYEYQAVAMARSFAGRAKLPSMEEQKEWEEKWLVERNDTGFFHEITPNFKEYFNALRDISGPQAKYSDAYELPAYENKWADEGVAVLVLKDKLVKRLQSPFLKVKAKL